MVWNPKPAEAWEALQAAEPPAWVLRHVDCVETLALAMADAAAERGLPIDRGLVQVGAILHDYGRAFTQDIQHATLGADALRKQDLAEPIVRIVERHTGAGMTADDAAAAGLDVRDRMPTTWEEKIVAHADNLYSGDKRLTIDQVVAKYRTRGLEEAAARIAALDAELTAAIGDLVALGSTT